MSLTLTAALLAVLPSASPKLDAVTVSANRRSQSVGSVLADVSVLERVDIESSGAPDLIELLRRLPGIDLARTGGSGQTASLFLRGTNSNHVLFLVDGVRVASANTGAVAYEHLPLDQIERIEIVRGPRASYYGSDAIGGVIAITTRERVGAGASLRIGTQGRQAGSAAYGVSGERGAVSVQVGGEHYDGFSAQTPDGFDYNPDDDGYRHRNLGLRGRLEMGSQQLGIAALATRSDVEFDQGVTAVDQHALALSVAGPIGVAWTHRLTLGNARDDLLTPVYSARFASRRSNLDWVHDIALGEAQHWVFGVNAQREGGLSQATYASTPDYSETLNHLAGFVGWQGVSGAFDHEFALRYDDHERFGGKATTQAALGWRFATGRVYASWGEGFRAPNLNELYSPGFGGLFAGNPNLDPERSRSLELGLEARLADFDWGLNAYRTRIDGLIAFQGGSIYQAVNIARAAIDGVELTARRSFGDWQLNANATWQDPRDARSGSALLRRPARKAYVDLAYQWDERFSISGDLGYTSERSDFAGDLRAYALLGVSANWTLSSDWQLGARLSNLTDHEYRWARGFAAPGRELLLSVSRYANP